ncbi:ribosome-binding factor A [Hathewaya proteolytica DSM 3090]|uniref:Ribosome-binding factor A n=1 Tax=Hathewaya proteolytica DSM 3090 TaxID=1121331 RepID=A0A1M6J5J3_9CLOT|nr:30S ribosome-binding factor RbfA [Hathewaya proteolytica]SHJ41948.1 ribosome-binding factor A [Hathewaya proteolytica DSM 3090]
MAKYRSGRINEEMRKHISSIIQTKIKDPRLSAMISVTRVDVTSDLSYAKVYVSIFANEEDESKSFDALKKSEGFIRSELGHLIKLRHIPQIIIEKDDSLAYGMHINSILKSIEHKDE